MFMFGITTFMFILGIITLVLETTLVFQEMQLFLDFTDRIVQSSNRISVVSSIFSRTMVRLHDAPISSAPLN